MSRTSSECADGVLLRVVVQVDGGLEYQACIYGADLSTKSIKTSNIRKSIVDRSKDLAASKRKLVVHDLKALKRKIYRRSKNDPKGLMK